MSNDFKHRTVAFVITSLLIIITGFIFEENAISFLVGGMMYFVTKNEIKGYFNEDK